MKFPSSLTVIVMVALQLPQSTFAQSPVLSEAARGMFQYVGDSSLSEAPVRTGLVDRVERYCGEVEEVYPKSSPSEDRWLDGELSGGGDRSFKAIATPEFGRRMALNTFSECHAAKVVFRKKSDFGFDNVG